MRRRLDLAAGLVSEPQVIYLDEPTTGLDPRARNAVWDTIRGLTDDGATVLLTTQHLDEADALADEIVVVDRGRVVAEGTSDELKAKIGGQTIDVRTVDRRAAEVAEVVAQVTGSRPESDQTPGWSRRRRRPSGAAGVVRRLDDTGIVASELSLRLPSLDEVFLSLTGHTPTTGAGERRRRRT